MPSVFSFHLLCVAYIWQFTLKRVFLHERSATHLNVSASLLALRFREAGGKTIRETIINERLNLVLHHLRHTKSSVNEIARECGFASANRLSHLFKLKYGYSISAWRNQC